VIDKSTPELPSALEQGRLTALEAPPVRAGPGPMIGIEMSRFGNRGKPGLRIEATSA
jgi:hypothetical protein